MVKVNINNIRTTTLLFRLLTLRTRYFKKLLTKTCLEFQEHIWSVRPGQNDNGKNLLSKTDLKANN